MSSFFRKRGFVTFTHSQWKVLFNHAGKDPARLSLVQVSADVDRTLETIAPLFRNVVACGSTYFRCFGIWRQLRWLLPHRNWRIVREADPRPSALQSGSSVSTNGKYSPYGVTFDVACCTFKSQDFIDARTFSLRLRRLAQLTAPPMDVLNPEIEDLYLRKGVVALAFPNIEVLEEKDGGSILEDSLHAAGFDLLATGSTDDSSTHDYNSHNVVIASPPLRFEVPPPGFCIALQGVEFPRAAVVYASAPYRERTAGGVLEPTASWEEYESSKETGFGRFEVFLRKNIDEESVITSGYNLSCLKEALQASSLFMEEYSSNLDLLRTSDLRVDVFSEGEYTGLGCATALSLISLTLGRGVRTDFGVVGSVEGTGTLKGLCNSTLLESCLRTAVRSGLTCVGLALEDSSFVKDIIAGMVDKNETDSEDIAIQGLEIHFCENLVELFELAFSEDMHFDIV
eukprot:g2652.t1